MTAVRTVWITRAQPGADRTADRLSACGFSPFVAPLLTIRPLDARPDLTGVQALAFTSRAGVEIFRALTPARILPVFAVGDATAASAKEAGFTGVRSAAGDLFALAALIRTEAQGLSILHPSAAEPAGDLATLVGGSARVTTLPVYEAVETDAAPPDAWDAVLVHSPRAARALVGRLSPDSAAGRLAAAISPAAAEPLSALPFADIRIGAAPTEAGLLAALGKPGTSV